MGKTRREKYAWGIYFFFIFPLNIHVSWSNPFTNFKNSLFFWSFMLCLMRNNKFISSTDSGKPSKVFEDPGVPSLNKFMLFSHMQSTCGWNSSWKKLREETQTLQVKAAEGKAILFRLQNLFPSLKENTHTRTTHACSLSMSRATFLWCALLFPQSQKQNLPCELIGFVLKS